MGIFRILHISDLHIATRPRTAGWPKSWRDREPWQFLKALVRRHYFSSHDPFALETLSEYLERHAAHVDGLLITGDVATTGTSADQQEAAKVIGQLLVPKVRRTWILPGNHDRFPLKWPAKEELASREFDSAFAGYWQCGQGAQVMASLMTVDGAKLVIVGADFSHPRIRRTNLANGEVRQAVLHQLEQLTDSVRKGHPSAVILWACHFAPRIDAHTPKELVKAPRDLELKGGMDLVNSAGNRNVLAILAGHVHNNCSYRDTSGVTVCTAGSASQFKTKFGYWAHLIELEVEPGGVVGEARMVDIHGDAALDWQQKGYTRPL